MTTNTNHKLDVDVVTVLTKMSKREASSLVRFLTDQIAESTDSTIDVRIDLRNDFDGAIALITAGTSTIFGSSAVIMDSHIRLGENSPKVGI
jgi:protein involved in sex pheromone biosynthesis